MNIRTMIKSFAVLTATTMLAFGAQATDYYWIGGASGNWNDGTKWSLTAGGEAASAYPNNIDSDTATIDAAATITVPEELKANTITLNQDVTFTGVGALRFYTMTGDGKVTMSGATFKTGAKGGSKASKDTTVNNRIVVAENTENAINICAIYQHFYMKGGIEGSGNVRVDEANPLYYGYYINGDAQSFSGTIVENKTGGTAGSQTGFGSALSVSPLASYTLDSRDKDKSNYPFSFSDTTVYVGAINGKLFLRKNSTATCNTLVVGSRNENCSFGGILGYSSGYPRNIIKVGTAELEYTGTIYGYVNISNGTFRIGSAGSVPSYIAFNGGTLKQDAFDEDLDVSAKIKNSNEQIVFDDEGVNHTWATALDASNEKGLTKKGAGTLSLAKGQTLNGPLVVEDGKVGLYGELSGEEETLFTWTTAGSSVTRDSFDIAVVAPLALALVEDGEAGTTSLVVERQVLTYTWVGKSGGLWSDAANWKVGEDPATLAPGASDTVSIGADAVIAVDVDQEFGTVNAEASAKLSILFSEEAQTFTAPQDFAGTIEAAAPFTATEEGGVYTAGARSDASYTWAGNDGVWTDAKNWRISGAATGVYPTAKDQALFNDISTVSLSDNVAISNLTFNADVILTGPGHNLYNIYDIDGTGKIVMSNMTLKTTYTFEMDNAVEFATGSTNVLYVQGNGKTAGAKVTLNGNLLGSGYVQFQTYRRNAGFYLKGDNTAFSGTAEIWDDNTKDNCWRGETAFFNDKASSANAIWNIIQKGGTGWDSSDNTGGLLYFDVGTNKFGALNGPIACGHTLNKESIYNKTWEIGARNVDCACRINGVKANRNFDLVKVGTAKLTFSGQSFRDYIVCDGTLELDTVNAVPGDEIRFVGTGDEQGFVSFTESFTNTVDNSIYDLSSKIANSTAAIGIDTAGFDVTWATAIKSSNVGGLTKKGEGTLTIVKGQSINGALQVLGGKIAFNTEITGEAETLMTWDLVDGAQEVTTADFDVAAPVAPLGLAIVTNDTKVSLEVKRVSQTYTYVGDDFGAWDVAANWKLGDAVSLVVPNENDTVVVNDGKRVYVASLDQTFGTVTLNDGAKLAVKFTANDETFTLTGSLQKDDIALCGPFDANSYDEESKTFTALRIASAFTWTDETADHEWNTVGNWKVGAYPTAVLPNLDDSTEFPAKDGGWTLSVNGSEANASNITFAADVTLANCTAYLRPRFVIGGEGVITLGDDAMIASYNTDLSVSNNLVVTASDTNPAQLYISGSSRSIVLYGDVTGVGTMQSTCAKNANYSGTHFRGDLRGFTGRFVAPGNSVDRNQTQFEGEYSWSEQARFEISAGGGTTCNYTGKTFKFGAFSGKMNFADQQVKYMTIEVGNLNSVDDNIAGTFFSSSYPNLTANRGHTLRKVGTGTLEVSVINNKAYDVNGGVMRLMNDQTIRTMWKPNGNSYKIVTDPAEATGSNDVSIVFSGTGTLALNPEITLDISGMIAKSTGAIAIDTEGVDRTWSTALAASNLAAITKKGEGTLTLTEVPAWEGKTLVNVEAGALVLPKDAPFTLGASTHWKLVGDTRVFTPGTPNKPVMIFVK